MCALGIGLAVSIITLAKMLEGSSPIMRFNDGLFSTDFGLSIHRRKTGAEMESTTGLALLTGIAIAAAVLLLEPLQQNAKPGYLFLCGVIAMCSMILPGISGSFILILMGNYGLVIGAIEIFAISKPLYLF